MNYSIGDVVRNPTGDDWLIVAVNESDYTMQLGSVQVELPAILVEDLTLFKWVRTEPVDEPPPPTRSAPQTEAEALYQFFATPSGQWGGWSDV